MKLSEIDHTSPLLESVMELGRKNSKTLGFFPKGAFREHARKKNIVVATENSELLGYILYRITQSKRIVSIAHLCIDEPYRNQGIAKALLDKVKNKYTNILKGIALNCREDYEDATRFWKKYGFKAVDKKRSRSKDKKYLIRWWYDFGNNNLFSTNYSDIGQVEALLDASILIKLREAPNNENFESHLLNADWLVDEAQFYFAPETYNEILRDKDSSRAAHTRRFIRSSFEEARFKPEKRDSIAKELKKILTGKSNNDESDRKQLAECIASGLEYFITTDETLIDVSEKVYDKYSIRIYRPSDFILFIDQITSSNNYHSYRVAGAKHEYNKIGPNEIDKLVTQFQKNAHNERKHKLRDILTSVAADVDRSVFKLVKDDFDKCLGFYAAIISEAELNVKAIRTGNRQISEVLFKQLIHDIISIALNNGIEPIYIQEGYLSDTQKSILETLGFRESEGQWIKLAVVGLKSTEEIVKQDSLRELFAVDELSRKLERVDSKEGTYLKLKLEKSLWPLKIIDIEVPTYIIPIRPYWASQLFDHFLSNTSLFGSDPQISWNKENVYYRSVHPVSEKEPARILWYLSSASKKYVERQKGIAACSYLDEVRIGSAKELYSRFKNYGIYSWKDVYKKADQDAEKEIKALKFSGTEVFKKLIQLNDIYEVFESHGRAKNTFASPVKIGKEVFNKLYSMGKQLEN